MHSNIKTYWGGMPHDFHASLARKHGTDIVNITQTISHWLETAKAQRAALNDQATTNRADRLFYSAASSWQPRNVRLAETIPGCLSEAERGMKRGASF